MKRDESKWDVFGIGIECCGPARVEGSWHTGKDEGVLGGAAIGGMTNAHARAADLHPALSSPSATPLRSGGYADKVKRADGTSASANAAKKNAPMGR